jgi:hypothetical protein
MSWPGLCQNTAQISPSQAGYSTENFTDESNNLNIVTDIPGVAYPPGLAYSTAGDNFLEMHYLASVDGGCVGSTSVYVKDNPQDYGSTPSDLSGQPFWESPDIIVVRHGQPVDAGTPPSDPQVTAGNSYDVWVRAHNDFSCSPAADVTAQVWWGDPAAGTPNWQPVPTGTGFAPKTLLPESYDVVGPFTWTVPNNEPDASVSPHECVIAAIAATGEAYPDGGELFDTVNQYQVAQRNVEIGEQCAWTLTNGSSTPAQLSVSLTTQTMSSPNSSQLYDVEKGDVVQVVFDDPEQALYDGWTQSATQPEGCTVTYGPDAGSTGGGGTTISMISGQGYSYAAVWGATLAGNATTVMTATVNPALYSGTTIDLAVGTYLSDGAGRITQNGGTCSYTTTADAGTGTAPIKIY